MRRPGWTPFIVPNGDDQNVYIVVNDFGRNGRAYRETDVGRVDLEAVIMDMLEGQYITTRSGSSASTLLKNGRRMSPAMSPMSFGGAVICNSGTSPFYLEDFVERHEGRYHDIQLPLPMRLV
jgi:hypothetical protein